MKTLWRGGVLIIRTHKLGGEISQRGVSSPHYKLFRLWTHKRKDHERGDARRLDGGVDPERHLTYSLPLSSFDPLGINFPYVRQNKWRLYLRVGRAKASTLLKQYVSQFQTRYLQFHPHLYLTLERSDRPIRLEFTIIPFSSRRNSPW